MKSSSNLKIYSEYCTGCGLCGSINGVKFYEDKKGFLSPQLKEEDTDLCAVVCPASGYALNHFSDGTTFGKIHSSFIGWSTSDDIRFGSSSGGVLTSLCLYLLENRLIDGVIQTRKSITDPRLTETIVSRTREDVLSCMGSRYTSSSPLLQIKEMIKKGKTYAFVGKPCDVSALKMYQKTQGAQWVFQIKYMLSFFCAGQPSIKANDRLLRALECENVRDCLDLQYRGNGWPGFTTIRKKNGTVKQMEYEKSWMTILGRDVRVCCRFCTDGTGEYADLSCGDAWHLTEDKRPDFSERPGRNVILCRTNMGMELLNKASMDGYIQINTFDVDTDKLILRQPYHYARKASLSSLKIAMKISGRPFPHYNNKVLSKFAKNYPLKSKIYRCLGTIQRIRKKII